MIAFALSPVIIGTINANEYLDIILTAGSINPLLEEAQVLIKGSENVAGFMIFLSITCFIVQIPTIVGRFILRCGTTLLFVLHIAVSMSKKHYLSISCSSIGKFSWAK